MSLKRKRITHYAAMGMDGTEVFYPDFVRHYLRGTRQYESPSEDEFDALDYIRDFVGDMLSRIVRSFRPLNRRVWRRRLR